VELLSLARRGSVTQLQRRTFPTAGSRQPLLVLRADVVADMPFHPRVRYVSHGWLTPAALGARRPVAAQCACGDGKARTSTRRKRACNRERRASARRGSVTQLQRRTFPTAGSRQPLLVRDDRQCRDAKASLHMQPRAAGVPAVMVTQLHVHSAETRMQPRAAGVSPPWFGNAIATAHVSHGWLTPAALDCGWG
jgi:hypothetical protein